MTISEGITIELIATKDSSVIYLPFINQGIAAKGVSSNDGEFDEVGIIHTNSTKVFKSA